MERLILHSLGVVLCVIAIHGEDCNVPKELPTITRIWKSRGENNTHSIGVELNDDGCGCTLAEWYWLVKNYVDGPDGAREFAVAENVHDEKFTFESRYKAGPSTTEHYLSKLPAKHYYVKLVVKYNFYCTSVDLIIRIDLFGNAESDSQIEPFTPGRITKITNPTHSLDGGNTPVELELVGDQVEYSIPRVSEPLVRFQGRNKIRKITEIPDLTPIDFGDKKLRMTGQIGENLDTSSFYIKTSAYRIIPDGDASFKLNDEVEIVTHFDFSKRGDLPLYFNITDCHEFWGPRTNAYHENATTFVIPQEKNKFACFKLILSGYPLPEATVMDLTPSFGEDEIWYDENNRLTKPPKAVKKEPTRTTIPQWPERSPPMDRQTFQEEFYYVYPEPEGIVKLFSVQCGSYSYTVKIPFLNDQELVNYL